MDHADELLRRIREERIRPIPRGAVLLGRTCRVLLVLLLVGLVSVSVALLLQELHGHAGRGWMVREAFSRAAPWIWGATSLLFAFVAYRIFRELPRAWRLRPAAVVSAILLAGAGAGAVLEAGDGLLATHRALAHLVPAYREAWRAKAMSIWHDPARGRLAGRFVDGPSAFVDVRGRRWRLSWSQDSVPVPGTDAARLLGRVETDSVFHVEKALPPPGLGAGKGRGAIP